MLWAILSLSAAIFSGIAIVLEKRALLQEHAMEFNAVFAIFSWIIALTLIPKIQLILPIPALGFVYLAAALSTLALLFESKGIRHLEVSIASPLLSFGPAITLLLSLLFLKESVSFINGIGILLIVLGAYFLETHALSIHIIEPLRKLLSHRYTFYLFFAMLLWSFVIIVNKYVLSTTDVYTFLFYYSLFIMINFLLLITLFHNGLRGIVHGIRNAGKWIFLFSALVFVSRLLYFNALALYNASLVYSILKMSTFFSTAIGGKLFHEHYLGLRTWVSLLMVLGVLLVVL